MAKEKWVTPSDDFELKLKYHIQRKKDIGAVIGMWPEKI